MATKFIQTSPRAYDVADKGYIVGEVKRFGQGGNIRWHFRIRGAEAFASVSYATRAAATETLIRTMAAYS